jgi:acyl-CoA synthetase (NDP forming)
VDLFFNPKSVAVVGASTRRTGASLLANLQEGFDGPVFPVNPRYDSLAGLKCYPSVSAIDAPVDLAIVLVPAPFVPQVLKECARIGVKRVIIESAGFAEIGPDGKRLQDECLVIAREAGIRLWGPNCMGLVDIAGRKIFSFMSPLIAQRLMPGGHISLVVQSGMLSAGFLVEVGGRIKVSVGKACSIGNMADVDECDLLEKLLADEQTRVVAMYLETFKRGRLFMELASRAQKPIVVLKCGETASGARAALSHTASLAGDARLTRGLLRGAGVTLADDFHELLQKADALALLPDLPPRARVAVLTFSGGAGILSCDLLEKNGFRLAELADGTRAALAQIFPPWQPPENPVDLWPSMDLRGPRAAVFGALEAVLADPGVDLLLVHFFLGVAELDLDLREIKRRVQAAGKQIAVWVIGFPENVHALQIEAQRAGLKTFTELGPAVKSLAAAAEYRPVRPASVRPEPAPQDLPLTGPGPGVWDERRAKELLAKAGIPVVAEKLVASADDALEAAREFGWPVVVKGLPPGEAHKSEQGLVVLDVCDPTGLARVFGLIQERLAGRGRIVVQPQVRPDYELIAGFLRDPGFGPCVMVGRGGVLAELDPDVAFDLAPLDPGRALALLDRLRARGLFSGRRGALPLDLEAMADLLVRLADLGVAHHDITQIDVNPVAVVQGRPIALDATVIVKARPTDT